MAGLSLSTAVLLAWGVWVLVGPEEADEPYVAPVPTASTETIDAPGAAATLQALVSAISNGDRAAAVRLASPDDIGTRDRLGNLVDVAQEAEMDRMTLRYVDDDGRPAADGTWAATVDATWAYAGFDAEPTVAEVSMRFRRTSDRVVLAGVGGAGLRTPVWMSGPMQVSRSRDVLVVAAEGKDLAAYVRLARSAVPTVTSVIPSWLPRLVVEVPENGEALEAALATEAGYYAQIAAVTGAGGEVSRAAPFHIFINPDVFAGLGREGREVVLAHEATHVATRAPLSKAPTWLTEGFADYVALRGTRLPLARTAGQIAEQVLADGSPTRFPSAAEFDTLGPQLGAVYEASWLACVVLARDLRPRAVADFYREVSAGAPLGRALRSLGLSEGGLLAQWRAELERLAELLDS